MVIGVKSTAIKFGDSTKTWLMGFTGLISSGLLSTGYLCAQTWPYYVGVALFTTHLVHQVSAQLMLPVLYIFRKSLAWSSSIYKYFVLLHHKVHTQVRWVVCKLFNFAYACVALWKIFNNCRYLVTADKCDCVFRFTPLTWKILKVVDINFVQIETWDSCFGCW